MGKVSVIVDLDAYTCWSCGVTYGVDAAIIAQRRSDGASFYCTNGHAGCFKDNGETRQRKRADAAEKERIRLAALLDVEKSNAAALSEKIGRLEKRVKNGICPCCSRTFQQLARHMKRKHPGYAVPV